MEILRNLISNNCSRIKERFNSLPLPVSIALAVLGSFGVLYGFYRYYKGYTERKELLNAKNFLQKEQYSDALQIFKQIVARNPLHNEAQLGEARCSYKLGQLDEAERAYQAVLQRELQNVEALAGLSKISEKRGEADTWINVQAACEATGLIPSLFYAKALWRIGQDDRALEQYVHIDNAAGLMGRAKILWLRDQLDQSVDLCRQACELEPQNAKALRSFAYYLKVHGQNERAIDYFKRSLEINPLHQKSHLNLISIYLNAGVYEKSVEATSDFFHEKILQYSVKYLQIGLSLF